jgi:hypothetical protein
MCATTHFISVLKTHNILVTLRKLFEIGFDICIFNEKREYVVYSSAVDIGRVFHKYIYKFL